MPPPPGCPFKACFIYVTAGFPSIIIFLHENGALLFGNNNKAQKQVFVVRTEADSTAHAIELIEPDCRGTARADPLIPRVLQIKGLGAEHVWYYGRAQPLRQVYLVENTPCIQLVSRRCIYI